ncbi:Cd2+/Zn2+-exporting ATPase [Halanaerobium saccharolyticum]|uniref:Cd(2+)-exporting ATPase n=1 Tax=Halanaerobium saccharolyticum TaxID=43595 RepID=A0A4V6Q829_9FIRM|nr:cation-translocating P-type ATPase [Halanaerobium saccharolyticum]RAK06467.1 Cd2+/Zn2+-exporting ATPase [Halanaerobium saccharolyticum]TDW01011.1 Cd2+/Zn2+-exporting ATPase [Halanaerobium saccharolyticum]TDX52592.1 Cd2+/Zn2+-exporting ATPase [Halanaerobium saccharolyticum]
MKKKLKIVMISGILIAIGWLSNLLNFDPLIFNTAMVAAAIVAGYQVAISAYNTLKMKVISINLLVTIAAVGAVIIGEYWEAAAVTFLFAFGSYLESRTVGKARDAIRDLMDLAPNLAAVIRDGEEKEIAAEEVEIEEVVIVRPGEKIPVDGTVIKGKSEVNQAAITGESIPVSKETGDEVFSGTINKNGYLEIKTERVGDDTTFGKIIELVEEAQEEKAPTQKLMERFSKYYTPGIILLALISYFISGSVRLSLTLLVIGCPGALVISTPISIVAGIGNGAKNGILIKGGEYLEKSGEIDMVAFDKTGTLSKGEAEVDQIITYNKDKAEVLRLAAAAEFNSEHHLARAIKKKAEKMLETEFNSPINFESQTGKGITAQIDGKEIMIGNSRLFNEQGIEIKPEIEEQKNILEEQGKTVVIVAENKQIIALISIADRPRENAYQIVEKLKQVGIKKVVMLTGDNKKIAESVASELKLDGYKAELLPEDKVKAVEEYQEEGYKVAMVGDGINDTPSLVTADIGIAMGAAGTDAAIDTADITLMADNLNKLPYAIGLSKAANRNIKQNVVFAVLIVFALLAGVLGQKVFLASGMLVHELSVLIVIFNAMRLLRYDIA